MSIANAMREPGLWRGSFGLAAVVLLGCGLAYSLLGTGVGRLLFPYQAQGSLVERQGVVVGSALIAQPFVDARYFTARPSAAAYDPRAASGSNQALGNPDLRRRIDEAVAAVAQREGVAPGEVSSDLVTQSGSGLDPHISPAAARLQAARVARARGLDPARVNALIVAQTQKRTLGLIGAPRVNVLALNLALDALQ